ncbi:hypothetical protein WA1_13655 [Scytonema hofmannii PCC 7110]|uniref:Exosortase n=1 Tax=Scytonema hofmannii PCC 7110 TaxID=128403 RepID=A0A139XEM4_9CYAN|nr:hypothetical protein [Scytonema hofmannii]KYC43139.1 hypothetical protein WA1_13655 [Scytonema hofmannii PCC 7110]
MSLKQSTVKSIAFAVSSLAAVVTAPQEASAELNVGPYGIQNGLEGSYLQYQLSGQDLSKMQGIAECSVGFGPSCNKTGAILQQLVESNNGPNARQLVMRAAGGEENFRLFASHYGNKPERLEQIPFASFWQDDNPFIMDGHRYLLGYAAGREPVQGLGQITKKFYWAPLQGKDDSLSPRNGLLNLKQSYGRLLMEEAAKIPNLKQQFKALGLEPQAENYYWTRISHAMHALNSGDEVQLQQNLLQVLSMPYFGEGGGENMGRPPLIDTLIASNDGEGLLGDVVDFPSSVVTLDPDLGGEVVSFLSAGEVVKQGGGFNYTYLLGLLALLPFLLGGAGDNSSGTATNFIPTPDVSQPPGETTPPVGTQTPGETTPPLGTQPPDVTIPPVVTQPPEVKQVPEPSTVIPYVLLGLIMFVFTQKQWRIQAKG